MKSIHKLFAITASLVLLSSLSQAALLTNEFVTAGGNFLTATNWSQGSVPVIGTDVGVLNNISATNGTLNHLNNKQLVLNGTSTISQGSVGISGTNFNITLNNSSRIYNGDNGGTLSNGVLTLNNSSEFFVNNTEAFRACTISLYGTSTGRVARATTLANGTIVNLNDSSVFRAQTRPSATDVPVVDATSYFNFNSTNALLKVYLGGTNDYSAQFNQMIVDGKIRANGAIVSTNMFKVTFIYGTTNAFINGTTVQLIPEPATAGLFGLAGAMVFLLRRQMKKKQTDEID